jgi:hypothetical protein
MDIEKELNKLQLKGTTKSVEEDFKAIKAVLGLTDGNNEFEGVWFGDIRRTGGSPRCSDYYELIGVKLVVWGGRFAGHLTVQRRVMTDKVAHTIDIDKVKEKFEELKSIAAQYKVVSDDKHAREQRAWALNSTVEFRDTRFHVGVGLKNYVLSISGLTEEQITQVMELVNKSIGG